MYIPPAGSKIFNAADYNYWDEIEKGIELYSNLGKVYITGDMNGRTACFSDILEFDKYIENNDLFLDMSHIPPRSNKDSKLDSHGRKVLDLCKSTGFVIANGRLGDDLDVGEITYCSVQGMSTVDYLLVSCTELESIHNFQILPVNEFSDHAPLFFNFLRAVLRQDSFNIQNESPTEDKIFWDPTKETLFINQLSENYDLFLVNENSDVHINDKINTFSKLLADISMKVFGKTVKAKISNKSSSKNRKSAWFNEGM